MTTEISSPLGRAKHLHREGRIKEANAMYHEVLRAQPNHPEALFVPGADPASAVAWGRSARAHAPGLTD